MRKSFFSQCRQPARKIYRLSTLCIDKNHFDVKLPQPRILFAGRGDFSWLDFPEALDYISTVNMPPNATKGDREAHEHLFKVLGGKTSQTFNLKTLFTRIGKHCPMYVMVSDCDASTDISSEEFHGCNWERAELVGLFNVVNKWSGYNVGNMKQRVERVDMIVKFEDGDECVVQRKFTKTCPELNVKNVCFHAQRQYFQTDRRIAYLGTCGRRFEISKRGGGRYISMVLNHKATQLSSPHTSATSSSSTTSSSSATSSSSSSSSTSSSSSLPPLLLASGEAVPGKDPKDMLLQQTKDMLLQQIVDLISQRQMCEEKDEQEDYEEDDGDVVEFVGEHNGLDVAFKNAEANGKVIELH